MNSQNLVRVLLQPAAERVARVVSVVPVPVPVMRDPELGGLVVTLTQLRQKLHVDGRIAPGQGVFGRLVLLRSPSITSAAQDCRLPGRPGARERGGSRAPYADIQSGVVPSPSPTGG